MSAAIAQRWAHAPTSAPARVDDCATPVLSTGRAAPLLAVCGVCGGAGTSTISALIARAAARTGHVLLADTGGPSGGLSARTGVQTPWSLPKAAELLVRDPDLARRLWATETVGDFELRIVAAAPGLPSATDPGRLTTLLAILRRDLHHALVVLDCGTLQHECELHALRCASHVAWVLPATPHGVEHARRLHALLPPRPDGELLLARRDPTAPAVSLRALTRLAAARRAALVHLPLLANDRRRALATAQLSLQAILGALRR